MIRAITVCQPYASLIIGWEGMAESVRKLVENRTWPCRLPMPFPLLIHAGKSRKWLATWDGPVPDDMPFGVILGRVTLVGCIKPRHIESDLTDRWRYLRDHQHASGPYCFVLQNPERFEKPIPYRGAQGFFGVPDSVTGGAP